MKNIVFTWIVFVTLVISVSGCTSLDIHPREGDAFNGPQTPVSVPIRLDWPNGDLVQGPNVEVNGTMIQTAQLTVRPDGADATVQLPSSQQHEIRVRTTQKCWYCQGGVYDYDLTHKFSVTVSTPPPPVGAVSLTLAQPTLVLERGKMPSVQVTITRTAPFTDAVDITTSALPAGVSQTALKISAGQTSGLLTFSATAAAQFGHASLTVKAAGPSGVPTFSKLLALIVSRETGAFSEANPNPYLSTLPSSKTSLTGTFRVDISTGAPSLPQPRKAVFFKGTQTLGSEIGFTVGSTSSLGGAGFCADNLSSVALPRGVVMSGSLPGFSSDNVFTFVDLTGNASILRQVPVEATKSNSFYFFQPRVFFNRDCTLALVAGSNKIGPSNNELVVINLLTGSPLASSVQFNASTFSAMVVILNNQPTVQVTADGNVTNMAIP